MTDYAITPQPDGEVKIRRMWNTEAVIAFELSLLIVLNFVLPIITGAI